MQPSLARLVGTFWKTGVDEEVAAPCDALNGPERPAGGAAADPVHRPGLHMLHILE